MIGVSFEISQEDVLLLMDDLTRRNLKSAKVIERLLFQVEVQNSKQLKESEEFCLIFNEWRNGDEEADRSLFDPAFEQSDPDVMEE